MNSIMESLHWRLNQVMPWAIIGGKPLWVTLATEGSPIQALQNACELWIELINLLRIVMNCQERQVESKIESFKFLKSMSDSA